MHHLLNGVVHPWLCDMMGHFTTRHYMAMFDDASYQLMAEAVGWDRNDPQWQGRGWADVRHEIEYVGELQAGDLLTVSGGIKTIGNSSLTVYFVMNNKLTGKLAATMTSKSVFFNLDARKATPIMEVLPLSHRISYSSFYSI